MPAAQVDKNYLCAYVHYDENDAFRLRISKGVSPMPRIDGTGPMGAGPMTGRAAGFCANAIAPVFIRRCRGHGFARGSGTGRGVARGWYVPTTIAPAPMAAQELAALKQQSLRLQADMDLIQCRIEELETNPT